MTEEQCKAQGIAYEKGLFPWAASGAATATSAQKVDNWVNSTGTAWKNGDGTAKTIMPAYYRTDHLNRVASKFVGQTILNGQEIEDVVAFLLTLNTSVQ